MSIERATVPRGAVASLCRSIRPMNPLRLLLLAALLSGCHPDVGAPPRTSTAPALDARSAAFLDTLEAAHVPLVLGPRATPRTGLMPDRWPTQSFVEHGRRRLRADRVSDRRRARLRHARAGRGARTLDDAALLLERAAGHRGRGSHRLPRVLLPLPRHGDRRSASRRSSCRRSTPRCSSPACCSASRYFDRDDADEARDPRAAPTRSTARVDWHVGAGPPAAIAHGLEARGGLPAVRLARLQRGDDPLRPGARLADASGRRRRRGPRGRRLPMGHVPRPGAPRTSRRCSATSTRTCGSTSAASRTRTCASSGIDYFENSRRATLVAARVRDRESRRAARATARDSGGSPRATGRSTATLTIDGRERAFHTYSARGASFTETSATTARSRRPRRRLDRRSRRRSSMPALRRDARRATATTLFGQYGFLDAFNPTLQSGRSPSSTAASCPASAGSTPTTSASTRGRSWR